MEPPALGDSVTPGSHGAGGIPTLVDLFRDERGRQVARLSDGRDVAGVSVRRAFPLTAPYEALSILDPTGHEVAFLEDSRSIPESMKDRLEAALAEGEFFPVVEHIESVSQTLFPCRWTVMTDRGRMALEIESEDDVRRLTARSLILQDSSGLRLLVRDWTALDPLSQRVLKRMF